MNLEISHEQLTDQQKVNISHKLNNLDEDIKIIDISDYTTFLKIKSKDLIPEIIKTFVYLKVSLYKVHLQELSLEDIFIKSS